MMDQRWALVDQNVEKVLDNLNNAKKRLSLSSKTSNSAMSEVIKDLDSVSEGATELQRGISSVRSSRSSKSTNSGILDTSDLTINPGSAAPTINVKSD